MLRRTLLVAAVAAAVVTPSCSADQAAAPSAEKTVAVLVQTTVNPFFLDFAAAAEQELGEGYRVVVFGGDNDPDKQAKQVQEQLVKKVDALLITPCNANAVGSPIRAANAAGVPVFTADTACLADDAEVVNHVATDNFAGGRLAGQAMLEALGGKGGKVLVLDFEQAQSCQERVRGFREVLDAHNQDPANANRRVEVVAQLPSQAEEAASRLQTKDALKSNRDLVGVFAINDPAALGAVSAIEEEQLQEQIKVIGFDGQKIGKLAIRDGRVFADPVQFPKLMGAKSAQFIKAFFAGRTVPPQELIPPELYYQKDAADDPDLADEK